MNYIANLVEKLKDLKLEDDVLDYISSSLSSAEPDEYRDICEPFFEEAGLDGIAIDAIFEFNSQNIIESNNTLQIKLLSPTTINPNSELLVIPNYGDDHNITEKIQIFDPQPEIKRQIFQTREIDNPVIRAPTPEITAISKVSRFHAETLETLSNKIDLEDVNISVNNLDLLKDAKLRLFEGVNYGLIGRNGVGKSTLMKCIGDQLLIGFPKNIRVLYIRQLEGVEDKEKTVLELVINSNLKANSAKQEEIILQSALETGSVQTIYDIVSEVNLNRLKQKIEDQAQIAAHRSGARGSVARTLLNDLESQYEIKSKAKLIPPTQLELDSSIDEAHSMLTEIHIVLMSHSVDAQTQKAERILKGLGFTAIMKDGLFRYLSGGWRIRVSLAQALFLEPDLLLLDEPTNHLDVKAIIWLQQYLLSLTDTTILVVSHDRAFLNAVCDETIVMKDKVCLNFFKKKKILTYHDGNYDEYEANHEDKIKRDQKRFDANEKKTKKLEDFIQKGSVRAARSHDDKRIKQIKSKKKKLEERGGMEVNEKGHRFKLNRDMVGFFNNARNEFDLEKSESLINWRFQSPPVLRHQGSLLQVDGVSFSYPTTIETPTPKTILADVNLSIEENSKIALVGANGHGKTTLVKLLTKELEPTKGHVHHHNELKIGYLSQDTVDSLLLHGSKSALQHLVSIFPGLTEQAYRGQLGRFGIQGKLATQPLGSLSGGQSVRVATAIASFDNPNLLILDEPTNHIDMDTITAMADCLREFDGAFVLVSHDQWFVDEVSEQVFLVGGTKVVKLETTFQDYVKKQKF